jgi:hypothetical protein
MFLISLFKTNPIAAVALLCTIVTLYVCMRLVKRQNTKADRYLLGLLGLIAMYQGLRILNTNGFWTLPSTLLPIGSLIEAAVAALCLLAAMMVKLSFRAKRNTEIQLRVVEAGQPAVRPATSMPQIHERTAMAVFGVNAKGEIDLWHNSSEDFFGWRKQEVLGTKLPFREEVIVSDSSSGVPRMLSLRTKRAEDVEAIVWMMPVPGESSSLVLVLDYRKNKKTQASQTATVRAAELAGAGA